MLVAGRVRRLQLRSGATSAGVQDGPTITGDARSVDGSIVSPSDAKPIDAPAIVVRYVQGNVATDTGNVIMTTLGSNETGADLNIVGVSWATKQSTSAKASRTTRCR